MSPSFVSKHSKLPHTVEGGAIRDTLHNITFIKYSSKGPQFGPVVYSRYGVY